MLKKKYFLVILLILFSCFIFSKPASAEVKTKCKGSSHFTEMMSYVACAREEIQSGKYGSNSECDENFANSPLVHSICKSYVKETKKKSKNNSKSNSSSSKNNSSNNSSNNSNKNSAEEATFTGKCRTNFLGLTSWDCGVEIKDETTLKTGIWQIVANVAVDITVIATYLVLGYVIYGGYLYIFSSGDPNKIASAKKTLTHAFIGLAIVMSAYVIVNSIRVATLGANGVFKNCATDTCVNANTLVTHAIQWVIGIAGIVAVIFVVYGGISYATSTGEPNKLQKAKQVIIYALIGLVIVALAEIITAFVSNMIRNANTSTSQIITPKEYHEKNLS